MRISVVVQHAEVIGAYRIEEALASGPMTEGAKIGAQALLYESTLMSTIEIIHGQPNGERECGDDENV
jgi:hypothetical protein